MIKPFRLYRDGIRILWWNLRPSWRLTHGFAVGAYLKRCGFSHVLVAHFGVVSLTIENTGTYDKIPRR